MRHGQRGGQLVEQDFFLCRVDGSGSAAAGSRPAAPPCHSTGRCPRARRRREVGERNRTSAARRSPDRRETPNRFSQFRPAGRLVARARRRDAIRSTVGQDFVRRVPNMCPMIGRPAVAPMRSISPNNRFISRKAGRIAATKSSQYRRCAQGDAHERHCTPRDMRAARHQHRRMPRDIIQSPSPCSRTTRSAFPFTARPAAADGRVRPPGSARSRPSPIGLSMHASVRSKPMP